MNIIRPKTFDEFVGKPELKHKLETFIKASKLNKTSLQHTLIYGPPGVGKTSIAIILANALNTKIKVLQATHLQKTSDLLNALSIINKGDVLFIDEIHALNIQLMEFLFPLMEDFSVNLILGKEFNSRITKMKMPDFTLIGATTQYGKILNALEERFGIVINIDYYEEKEIIEIIENRLRINNVILKNEEIKILAKNSRYTPRLALRITDRICDYKMIDKNLKIEQILKSLEIYEYGLTKQDLIYLKALNQKNKSPLGIKSISLITNIDQITLENKIEPFLLKIGLIEKTIRGRVINQKGKNYLKNANFFF